MKRFGKAKKWAAIVPLALMSITMAGTPALVNPVHAAAAQSFSDVPAGHWAYSAVTKLAKAGLIDGYADKTFKGDRTMSRYEFAFIVAKAMDKFDAADEANKKLIDQLSAEFAGELNRLGARVAKVEAKTNSWISGETRFRYFGNSTDNLPTDQNHVKGSNKFDFRQRVLVKGNINDDISVFVRLQASTNVGSYEAIDNSSLASAKSSRNAVSFDAFAITAKNVLGMDKVRIGRYPVDTITHNLMGNAAGRDGVRIDKKFGDINFTGSVIDISSSDYATGNAKTLTTGQLSGKAGKVNLQTGYFWGDQAASALQVTNGATYTSSKGWTAGFDTKLSDNLMLIADFVSTKLTNATNLPSSPKGWAVELSNATKQPPIFYSAKYLVNHQKVGDFGWSLSYRSVDAGTIPNGATGFDQQAMSGAFAPSYKFDTQFKGTDNIKGFYLAFQSTVSRGVVWSIEGQSLKIKNTGLTGGVSDLGKTYMTKLEFFY